MSEELPTVTIPAGTVFYHGTAAEEEFDELIGPAWVSQSRDVANEFTTWHAEEGAVRRILEFTLNADVTLLLVESTETFEALVEQQVGYDASNEYAAPSELAELVCDAGFDGWTIPSNYPSGDDTLLCDPERVLDFVEYEEVW